ncbi:MAG TPA: carbohydrate ABC transporter permease [Gaiellaceae bacterium]|jgi:multiple sugar transport system permease protein|nr:carbohydrate ABC transporter permease [Gaiellaceae bacterium]
MTSISPERAGVPTPDIPPVTLGPERSGWRRLSVIKQLPFVVLLAAFSILFIYPFLWLISASLKTRGEVFDNKLIPSTFAFHNYVKIWQVAPVLSWFANSMYISILAALLVTFASALTAFAFAYFRFPFRNLLFGCVLGTMMLPGVVTMIPVYLIWHHIGLSSSQIPLWAPNLFGSAFYIFLQRQFFMGIPRTYFEAARMDGDNYFSMFWRIALPLAKPALIVTFLFEFKAKWNDLMTPLIYLHGYHQYTIPLGLYDLLGVYSPSAGGSGDYEWIMAAFVISTAPLLLIFAFGQRYFVRGITLQGYKG